MATLDLFKKRQPHTVYIEIDGQKQGFKLPTQYTVEEVERLLEIQVEKETLLKSEVDADSIEATRAVQQFWEAIYDQLLILFNHYQPEIERDFLLKHVPQEHAVEIIAFFTEQHVNNVEEDAKASKKKLMRKN